MLFLFENYIYINIKYNSIYLVIYILFHLKNGPELRGLGNTVLY